jgi:hypothetical protein
MNENNIIVHCIFWNSSIKIVVVIGKVSGCNE